MSQELTCVLTRLLTYFNFIRKFSQLEMRPPQKSSKSYL